MGTSVSCVWSLRVEGSIVSDKAWTHKYIRKFGPERLGQREVDLSKW